MRSSKPLHSLENSSAVVFERMGGGGSPSFSSGRSGKPGRRRGARFRTAGAARRRAITPPVAAMAFKRRVKCPIQAERRYGFRAASARAMHASDNACCARRCSSRARFSFSAFIRPSECWTDSSRLRTLGRAGPAIRDGHHAPPFSRREGFSVALKHDRTNRVHANIIFRHYGSPSSNQSPSIYLPQRGEVAGSEQR